MTPDQVVRDTITTTGLDRTLFVEAGAGTGKTSALVARIANLVVDEGVRLADIAAITFTDAAAAELRDRVRGRFEHMLATSDDPTTLARAAAALADADMAAISTLHGFAQRILSEHPAYSGLPPRIGVLDEVSSSLEREERWERFVDSLYDDPANEELLVRAALLDIAIEPKSPQSSSLKAVATRLGESWDRLGPVAALDHPPLAPVDLGSLRRAVDELTIAAERCSDPADNLYCRIVDSLLPRVRAVLDPVHPHDQLRALATIGTGWKVGNVGRAASWGGEIASARDVVAGVGGAIEALLARARHEVLIRLVTLTARDLLGAAEARRAEGRLEFHDLLVFASQLLATSEVARQRLHDRYLHLLLDEFQDTDPLQIRLAVFIAGSISGEPPERWADVAVPEGRLFFVGDPKQSIYRFRRADIELFLAARDRFGAADALQRLTTNFRTVAPIISWINAAFHHLMPDEIAGMQPAYEPLHPHRSASSSADHRPVLLGGPHHDWSAVEVREAEAAGVAELISSIRSWPQRWPVGDPSAPDGWRPAGLGDVTILIPTRTELPALETALRERGVAYHLATGTLIYDTQEVRDALAVLSAIADASDELALVAALRSPLYACTDVELFEFHAAGGRWDLQRPAPDTLAADHPVVAALAHLRQLWEERWWRRPSALVTRLFDDRRAALVAFGSERYDESWSRLRFLVDQARSFEESNGSDLRAFLQWAELQRDETVTVHQPVTADAGTAAVSIMTIHGAKGLEFPITILSGMSAKPMAAVRGASVIWDVDGLPGVRLRAGIATANHDVLVPDEHQMAECERIRLLYVAATRARDHLVVSCHHKEQGSFAQRWWEASVDHPDAWRRHEAELLSDPPRVVDHALELSSLVDPADRQQWAARRTEMLAAQGSPTVVSATAVARAATGIDLGDDDTSGAADPPISTEGSPTPVRRRGRAGTAIGRATHATLQFVDLHDPRDLAAEAERQAHLEAIPDLADTVAAMAGSALASPTVRGAERYHREVYVAAPVGERTIEGYVDLLIETDDGLVVVDYKTDTVRSAAEVDAKLAAYEMQGAAYAVAIEASTGLPVVACRFVFCRPGGAIEREVADLAGAMERVRALVGRAVDLPVPP